MPKQTVSDLLQKYNEAESIDKALFAEQRSNVLLVTGHHYNKGTSRYLERIRSTHKLSNEVKIRLTKNHIQRICKIYRNNIVNHAPGVQVIPNNPNETQDQKAAQLHQSVWEYIKSRHSFADKVNDYASDFIELGEVFVKVFWDGTKGDLIPIEDQIDAETGEVLQRVQMMSGDLIFERVYGFNVLRDPAATDISDARWVCIRKLINKNELKLKYGADEDKRSMIEGVVDDTYQIFNGSKRSYESVKNKVMVREFYFKPEPMYPQGYFYISTDKGILEEGPLPGGIFPIVDSGFDRLPTCPRHQSIIKSLRPYQAEINRAGSKIAEHHSLLGDDKLLIQAGTKIAHGGQVGGVRGVQYTGVPPTILPGRSGAQYLEYMNAQITEMYQVANINEDTEEKFGQLDSFAMLYRGMRDKRKFSIYAQKFERFLIKLTEVALDLYKYHAPEQMIIPAIGREEIVNMQEFKNSENMHYQVRVVERTEDAENMLGKYISLTNVLQYAGGNLSQEDVGMIIKNLPFANSEEIASELTIDYDISQNMILALDRGEEVPIGRGDNPEYMLKRLNHRMKKADFKFLPPESQQLYDMKMQEYEQTIAQQQLAEQQASAGFIPTGGYLVGCDFYVTVPKESGEGEKLRRARIPYESISWLLDRLQQQGLDQAAMEQLDSNVRAEISQQMLAEQQAADEAALQQQI